MLHTEVCIREQIPPQKHMCSLTLNSASLYWWSCCGSQWCQVVLKIRTGSQPYFWQWWPKTEVQAPPAKIRFTIWQEKSSSKTQIGRLLTKEALLLNELTGRVDTRKAFSAFRHQIWITCAVHFRVHYSIWKAAVKEIGTRSTKNTMDIKNIEAVVANKPQSGYYRQSSFPPLTQQQKLASFRLEKTFNMTESHSKPNTAKSTLSHIPQFKVTFFAGRLSHGSYQWSKQVEIVSENHTVILILS